MGLDDGPYGIGWWFQIFTSEMRWLNDQFLSIWKISKLLGFQVPGSCKWLTSTSLYAWMVFVHRSSLRGVGNLPISPRKFRTTLQKYHWKNSWRLESHSRKIYKNGRNWSSLKHSLIPHHNWGLRELLLIEKFLHHLRCIKPCKSWGKLPINWC